MILDEYAKRIAEKIKLENPVLIGVSLVVFWFKKWQSILILRKVIIISSVKSNLEFPSE
jgi:hypothetical protein